MERVRGIPQVGDVLNARYRLNAELGDGGFAKAFAGQDLEKKQGVAVKVLKLSSEEQILQFSEEAYLMVNLEDPHIVPFVDYVPMREGIHPYIVMKLATRGSLKDEMKERQKSGNWIPMRRSVFLLDQAGAGLKYLHEKKIVHRDVKPENLLLASENELWLSDFGIAKNLIGDPSKTGHFAGTPHYAAPEQIRGKPEVASDIYALGVTAYYLLTRRLPFIGNPFEVMKKHLYEMPIDLLQVLQSSSRQDINLKLLTALNPIVLQALAKDPDKRYTSVTLFTRTLWNEYEQLSGEKFNRAQFEVAKSHLVEVVVTEEKRKKKEHDAAFQKGLAFYNQKNYQEALEAYDQVIQLDPNDNFAYYNRGLALKDLGRHEEALEAYEKAIELDPKYINAFYNRGHTLFRLQRHEEALKAYHQVIQLDPNDSEAFISKGLALGTLGRYEEALRAYDQAILIAPDSSRRAFAFNNKGLVLKDLGRYEEALRAYDQAIELDPNSSFAFSYFSNKGNTLDDLGRREEALRAYGQAVQFDPMSSLAFNSKGVMLDDLGRHEEALRAYEKAIELDPEYVAAYYNKGLALNDLGRHEEALEAFKEAERSLTQSLEELDSSIISSKSILEYETAGEAASLRRDLVKVKSKRKASEEIIKNKNRKGWFKRFLGK